MAPDHPAPGILVASEKYLLMNNKIVSSLQDPNFLSPFAKNARANGLGNIKGGKEDDITVLLAAVKIQDTLAEEAR